MDQKDWIALSKAYNNPQSANHIISSYIIKLANSGKYVFPFSLIHMLETLNCLNDNQRMRLLDYVVSVSKGNYITHYSKIVDTEVLNAFLVLNNKTPSDIRGKVFSRSIFDMLGVNGFKLTEIESGRDASLESYAKVQATIDNPDHIKKLLKTVDINTLKDIQKKDEIVLQEIKEDINVEKKYPEHVLESSIVRFWDKYAFPIIFKVAKRYGFDIKALNVGNMSDHMKLICSHYVLANLFAHRKRDSSKELSANDLNDIDFLAIALPYSDIVTVDKAFFHHIKQAKLDEIYGTRVLKNISELYEELRNDNREFSELNHSHP